MNGFHFQLPFSPALALGLLFLGLSNEASLHSAFGAGLLFGVSVCALGKALCHVALLPPSPAA